jgi:hypothetical protein
MDDFDSVCYYENYVKQKPNGSAMPNAKNLILEIDRTKSQAQTFEVRRELWAPRSQTAPRKVPVSRQYA